MSLDRTESISLLLHKTDKQQYQLDTANALKFLASYKYVDWYNQETLDAWKKELKPIYSEKDLPIDMSFDDYAYSVLEDARGAGKNSVNMEDGMSKAYDNKLRQAAIYVEMNNCRS